MRYLKLRENLKYFTIFTLNDIKKIDPDFGRSRLNEWQKKGYIKKIIKNYYIFSDLKINDTVIFEIANKIYAPSYISLEMALSYYNLIPESVYVITSVSTRRTYNFNTNIGVFNYRNIRPNVFFGYNIIKNNNNCYKIACPEKAILDFLYYRSDLYNESNIELIRINVEEFKEVINQIKFEEYLRIFNNKQLSKKANILWGYINNART